MMLNVKPKKFTTAHLKAAREAANLSQEELAAMLGVSRRTLQLWEAGRSYPQPRHRRLIQLFLEDPEG